MGEGQTHQEVPPRGMQVRAGGSWSAICFADGEEAPKKEKSDTPRKWEREGEGFSPGLSSYTRTRTSDF